MAAKQTLLVGLSVYCFSCTFGYLCSIVQASLPDEGNGCFFGSQVTPAGTPQVDPALGPQVGPAEGLQVDPALAVTKALVMYVVTYKLASARLNRMDGSGRCPGRTLF